MKNYGHIFFLLIEFFLTAFNLVGQVNTQQEVLIIGTMHEVPKIIGNSYKPLLKKAKAYDPQAIFVERPQASDTLSLQNVYTKFLHLSDSLNISIALNQAGLAAAMAKPLSAMNTADFKLLNRYYILERDYANAEYYKYLSRYGFSGPKKPTRNENGDLTAKLGIHLGLKEIHSMDNQWYRKEYHQAWSACVKAGKKDGEIEILKKLNKGAFWKERYNGATAQYGRYTNAPKTTQLYHTINSFRYRETPCEPCTEGGKYWDLRNLEMARNIGNQIRGNGKERSVVVVGAGHVVGLKEALAAEYPEITVKLLNEVK